MTQSPTTCPQCRAHNPEQFLLVRQTVFLCGSCGYSWTAPPSLLSFDTTDRAHLAEARDRLREALLRFLRPAGYANSGVAPTGAAAPQREGGAPVPTRDKVR